MAWFGRYVVAAVIFGVLDYLWLGVIARPVYEEHLGDWLADSPNMVAALAFYAIYVFGMVWLAITPALAQGSWVTAVLNGAVLGLVAYATWNLTNLAVLDGYPSGSVLYDLAWGTVGTAATCGLTFVVSRRVRALR
ncbi:DUF2177 family protein [Janibacter sp. CX7]|jgi:uncharacterized membrane protein|uniref:DUF2177 family protein n=1 Tax=unclassified Janibacter TaxID=2649294 RepID=UPI0020CC56DA|nr:DUF2177 family protein [Janibacter sp. CX7]UTT65712.1 DUF2177 family protein [Janibacter sp. CX7]